MILPLKIRSCLLIQSEILEVALLMRQLDIRKFIQLKKVIVS